MTASTFALIGAAGYVAPKHGAAIKAVGGRLVAACDVHDAVGWLDRDWPECEFFTRIRPFGLADYYVVATPNSEHYQDVEEHLVFGDVICEKPLVLRSELLDALERGEACEGHRVFTILNLRHHPEMLAAKVRAEEMRPQRVTVRYATPRGPWYDVSWKGDPARSGGLLFNIAIHVLDAVLWMFGPADTARVVDHGHRWAHVETQHGDTHVSISLTTEMGADPGRYFDFNGTHRYDLTWGFGELHVACYREILAGNGPGIAEARPSIELAERLTGQLG